jgi:predicted O-methyltransferase YrrM
MAWTDKLDPSVHNCVSAGVPPRPRPREADAVTGRLVHAARKALRRPANDRPACADQWLATIDAETDDRASVSTVLDVLAMSRRHPIINRLPNVPIAHHDREFETLLGWIDELADVRVLVEIGSRFGGSFYALASHVGAPLTAISIDLPGGPWGIPGTDESLMKVASDLRGQDIDAHVLLGDSHDSDTVNRLTHVLAGRPIDVLFVDGDHRLAGVAADLSLYPPLVRPGGLVAVHDVGWPYGRDAVDRFDAQAMHTLVDVQAAFTALARGRRWAIETHQWGMGAVWM